MRATRRADDDFELSCTGMQKIAFDALPSNKRSEAKKRSVMLDAVFQTVRARLDAIKSEPDRANSAVTQATSVAIGDAIPAAQC